MYERFIVTTTIGLYGHYGYGDTEEQALAECLKAGAKKREPKRVMKFTSEFPFAPTKREAKATESDCWVGRDGSINWIRCDRVEDRIEEKKGKK